jgi:hypothetical protein
MSKPLTEHENERIALEQTHLSHDADCYFITEMCLCDCTTLLTIVGSTRGQELYRLFHNEIS